MTVTWKRQGNLTKAALAKLHRDMEEAADDAAETFDSVVQNAGRVGRTGDMTSAPVTARVYETDKTIRAVWGWSLADQQSHRDRMTRPGRKGAMGARASLSYFELQDHGFNHASGKWVQGMMAYKESRDRFMDYMRSKGY